MSPGPIEILIVEDTAVHAQILRRYLAWTAKGAGREVDIVVAASASAARAHIALRRFDAVVLDLFLADAEPGESVIPRANGARVVVLSGIDALHDADRLAAVRALRPAAIMAKPSDWSAVALTVLDPWIAPPPEPEP